MRFSVTLIVALLLAASNSHGRPVRKWTYNDLLTKSDLVVIAHAIDTRKVASTEKPPGGFAASLKGPVREMLESIMVAPPDPEALVLEQVETTLHIRAVFKGAFDKERLVLVHFRWKTDDKVARLTRELLTVDVGPRLVVFPGKNSHLDTTQRDCLLFLKLRKDGDYEPVSGQFDPIDSVRWFRPRRP